MHILPGVLALLLLPAAALAASPFDKMVGDWTGTVMSDDGCEWKVRSSWKGGKTFSGDFSYSGECAEKDTLGTFRIKLTGKSCYSATVNVSKLPPMPVTGCADKAGNISFKTAGFSGKLAFGKGNKTFALSVEAELGSAKGQFRRALAPKRQRGSAQAAQTEKERALAAESIVRDAEGMGGEEGREDAAPPAGEDGGGARNDEGNSSEVLIGGY